MDISEILNDPWGDIIWRIRKGQFPSDGELANALRTDRSAKPLAPAIREYLAGRIEKTIRRPRGKPRAATDAERWTPTINIATQVRALQAAYKLGGFSRPRDRAIEDVARNEKRSTDTIRARVKSLSKAPRTLRGFVPDAADAQRTILKLREAEGGGSNWLSDFIHSWGGRGVSKSTN